VRDTAAALRDLRELGVCVIADVLKGEPLARARDAIYRAAEDDARRGRAQHGFGIDLDEKNVRVWNLLNRDPVFGDLAEHEAALALVRATLGWPVLLSNISGNITGPGASAGVLHADQVFVPEPWPAAPQGINVAWCLDDFTRENGATEVAVGSHRWNRMPAEADAGVRLVPAEAPAGSVIAFESRIWHRTGANTSRDRRRAAVFPFYTTTIYRTQENWFLSLSPGVVSAASETLLTLLAYKSEGFGLVYGRSPR
ncbi:MAG: phytanoyl-CoA dioxygenase family protein, partial [Parvularculaceae bacterium]|nr:phytanoyl-CoA dioxygenase family protein [Parvularculaceae bacterium]